MVFEGFKRYYFEKRPPHLVLHVTANCNLRCRHCFSGATADGSADLPVPFFQRLAKEMGPLMWMDVSGGEPFLRKDLVEIVSAFDAHMVQIPTNGMLPEQIEAAVRRLRAAISSRITISISIDGLRSTHDALRRHQGSWDAAWSTYDRIRSVPGVWVKINTVLSDANRDEILELMDVVWARRPDYHSVILLRGNPRDPSLGLPGFPDLAALGRRVRKRQARYTRERSFLGALALRTYQRCMWEASLRTLRHHRQVLPCLGGRAHVVCWSDGRVGCCEMLPSGDSVVKQTLAVVMASSDWQAQVRDIRAGRCYCTHNCVLFDSLVLQPWQAARFLW